jgi:hypothetical protein
MEYGRSELTPKNQVRYLTDDRGDIRPGRVENELVIEIGGNGDWYVSVVPKGSGTLGRGVRICTSGGAASRCPGLPSAIADAFRAIEGGRK